MNDYSRMDYERLVVAIKEQILGSDLADSTLHGTGFGSNIAQVLDGYLQGPPLLVQVIAITEVDRPLKPRVFKLKLSDGDKVREAFTLAQIALSQCLNFENIPLGFKVSTLHYHGIFTVTSD